MLRASGFALGMFIALWGVAFLYVDQVVISGESVERDKSFRGMLTNPQTVDKKTRDVFDPPEWAAFLLMSVGSVTMLYAAALPKRH